MASRRSSLNRKNARHRSGRFSFETKLRLFAALLSLPTLGLLFWLMIAEHLSTAAILSVLTIASLGMLLAIAAFMDQVIRPLQTLANVVAALREEDYSFRARGAKLNDPFGDLAIEINALADMHQAQRLGALEAAALFRRVISELDAPVLAFDQRQALRLLNPAAERVFQLNSARDLGRTAAALRLESLLLQPDEGIIQLEGRSQLDGQIDGQGQPARTPTRWMVRRSTFRQHGEPHTLLLLSDVSSALREEERIAWRRLIRVLGHEISNSLAPIKSIAGSLRSRLPQAGAASSGAQSDAFPDFERGLSVIEGRAESLNRFVQAYRQLAQLPAPVLRRVAVKPLLERVVSLETRLDVALDVEPGRLAGVHVAVDPDQMEQLLINLVRNGVEAAFSAGDESITAGLPFDSPQVAIRVEQQGELLAILVKDNGPGITNPSNLFVPFYTTKKSGSGVGLVLARQIAEAHGGTLQLHNRIDTHGCQAELRIPLAPQLVPVPERLPENQPSSRM
jgi:two-component system, NtrC family, nitrogen regulation sensor histidine kinase NtrY